MMKCAATGAASGSCVGGHSKWVFGVRIYLVRVRTGAIALVDERDARDIVPPHLSVHGQGLRLNAANRAEHEHSAVQHAKRAFNLDREIDVARGVNDVDLVASPAPRQGRGHPLSQDSRAHSAQRNDNDDSKWLITSSILSPCMHSTIDSTAQRGQNTVRCRKGTRSR
jgi:hypothetical protein